MHYGSYIIESDKMLWSEESYQKRQSASHCYTNTYNEYFTTEICYAKFKLVKSHNQIITHLYITYTKDLHLIAACCIFSQFVFVENGSQQCRQSKSALVCMEAISHRGQGYCQTTSLLVSTVKLNLWSPELLLNGPHGLYCDTKAEKFCS